MAIEELGSARLLLIDGDAQALSELEQALHNAGGHEIAIASTVEAALQSLALETPDLILLDFAMPPVGGFAVYEGIKAIVPEDRFVPVIMLTGQESNATKQRALEVGVTDFLHKEHDLAELLLRVRNVLRYQALFRQVDRQRGWLEETVRLRTRQLQSARREVLERLALAAEYRDDDTGEHTRRVGTLSARIARAMGEDDSFAEAIGAAALLHDLGKIGIPDSLLLKKGPLTPPERTEIQEHARIGAAILEGCTEPVMMMAQEIALTHHERWDGGGYPHGLVGDDIPLCGRIVSVADTYDAITSRRPYKEPRPRSVAIEEVVACAGRQFDPRVVQAFLAVQKDDGPELNPHIGYTIVGQPALGFD